jgi:hypothetical protein
MHRRKNNPSTVTKKPRVTASGGIVATAISVAAVMTAAAIGGTNVVAEAVEAVVATIAARAAMVTAAKDRDTVMAMATGMGAIRDRGTFPSQQKACGFRSLLRSRRCTSW